MSSSIYDIIIVGAGVAGSSLAYALSKLSSSSPSLTPPLKILLLERNLAEPNRIAGELLQPGGVEALKTLGLGAVLSSISAVPIKGYAAVHRGRTVQIPYPDGYAGLTFHHGKFVQALREEVFDSGNIQVFEGVVTDLMQSEVSGRVIGVKARLKDSEEEKSFLADLTVVADGSSSNLRSKILASRPHTDSRFVGALLEDIQLPYTEFGTVVLIPNGGPALIYQIDELKYRLLIDVREPWPKNIQAHIESAVLPYLPSNMHLSVQSALSNQKFRQVPNLSLSARLQGGSGGREGCILLGDAWNIRHPLTGGGMTVALNDVVLLKDLFCEHLQSLNHPQKRPFSDWSQISPILFQWHWRRKRLASTINMVSMLIYKVLSRDGEDYDILREGFFRYFQLQGNVSKDGLVWCLSGIKPDPSLLLISFFKIAFYTISLLFTCSLATYATSSTSKQSNKPASMVDYPGLVLKSVNVIWTGCVVFLPLAWSEIKWW